ncbi:hypothetical protein CEXT_378001 [Caerostris extrusa]|uniref:Uncharacterized protein n=1 Tax=Caerostris extrusa TaxID=172846 RepID=A0AAV4NNE7_CAEEX|nr:hypothetical protein CEXT_378001 [Caerostris extrusa]
MCMPRIHERENLSLKLRRRGNERKLVQEETDFFMRIIYIACAFVILSSLDDIVFQVPTTHYDILPLRFDLQIALNEAIKPDCFHITEQMKLHWSL